ncbi:hypothetical protein K466DRAFT_657392 [Polyporus arcularius HHB13444]|uniref:Uncharacterized protein n=1 Tax=Polyporus arcularius HHB13444 TaxID=1314778 RepID=A0A5C3Q8V3_9APHY|nr:hypothetical protein K466DRAFT_657392 [Polyporus arcularius HHB13444]
MSSIFFHTSPRADQVTTFSALNGAIDSSRISTGYPGKENRNPSAAQRPRYTTSPQDLSATRPRNSRDCGAVLARFVSAIPGHGGWRFADICAGWKTDFVNPDGPAIPSLDPRSPGLELRIVWPGYAHVDGTRRIKLMKAGRPTSQFELAVDILDAYEVFVEKARRGLFNPQTQGDLAWKIHSTTSIKDFVLVALVSTDAEHVLQAVVEPAAPRR